MGARLQSLTGAIAALMATAASQGAVAQVELPQINITDTRLTGIGAGSPPAGVSGGIAIGGGGITGASTTVITSEDIARSPAQTLPDILSREPGIQVQNLYGGVNGSRSVVDMRGFGAAANSNTLFLINGRRIQDLDMVGVDLAAIPRDSIERIEITRGNSGTVLYGDGAVGGVVNIITKTGVGQKPYGRIEGAFGSFRQRERSASLGGSNGNWSASAFYNGVNSAGYRENNGYKQHNGVADLRYTSEQGGFYLNLSGDDQHVGLPGHRRYSPLENIANLYDNRRGAFSPYDFAAKQGQNVTAGVTRMLAPGIELILDGGIRRKEERAQFHFGTELDATSEPRAAVQTTLVTKSVTPRLKIDTKIFGLPVKAIGGFDYYDANYDSDRPAALGDLPIHRYDLQQASQAGYWQQTVTLPTATDVSGGVRVQRTSVRARDTFDRFAPGAVPVECFPFFGCFGDLAGLPLDKAEVNRAYHIGVEQRVGPHVALFGRMAQSFRVPNVDERVGAVTSMNAIPTTFDLRTQHSHDWEAGARFNFGTLDAQWSIWNMNLTDEIHFRYGPDFEVNNINLDPTRRYGSEGIATWRVTDAFRLKGGIAYTRAVFREGIFAGNNVPLVSKWTGNAGVSWDLWQKWLTLDVIMRYVGGRRMDNDQINMQPLIPEHTTFDLRVGGQIEQFFWSFAVLNLTNVQYFDYAIASPFPFGFGTLLGTFNAYPQPGRSYMVRAGMTW